MATQAVLLRPVMRQAVLALSSPRNLSTPPSRQSHSPSSSSLRTTAPVTAFNCRPSQQRRLLQFHVNAGHGALGIEPDLQEDFIEGDEFKTAGEDTQETEFAYGKYDGAHTWHAGDDNVEFIDAMSTVIEEAGGPNDHPGQAFISWLFLPVIFSGLAFGVQPELLFLVTVLFIFSFIGIEMTKADKPSNFEYDPNFPGSGYKPEP